jgi:fructosamine-3-kinase
MTRDSLWARVSESISEATGTPFHGAPPANLGGGCINAAFRVDDGERSYFVKTNRAEGLEMFEAEAAGLAEMDAAGGVRVPRPVCSGSAAGHAFLVLEYLPLGGRGDPAELGRGLAAMHRRTAPEPGWWRDNTIGSTPQPNESAGDWAAFWRERRLGFQLDLVRRNGYGRLADRGERLRERVGVLLDGHRPEASLLHGDLWSGNYGYTRDGTPVIFDPAVYYGDREADLAMTELFGGFPGAFYRAYREAWPLPPGYELRRDLYNLYHVLNHVNLFGGGYGGQAERLVERLLAAAG